MSLAKVLAFLLLIALLPGQQQPPPEGGENPMERRMQAAKERALKQGRDLADVLNKEGKEGLSEEELNRLAEAAQIAKEGVRGAGAFCRFVASIKPAKLMPGQSGTMVITAVLTGQAVLPAPAAIERLGGEQQGLVTLGPLTARPAEAGRLAPAYLGRPVYDNYAVFEVPVTMSPQAEIGKKQAVQVDLRFDIFDGTTAQAIGKFIDRAAAEVEVGRVADPMVGAASTSVGAGKEPVAAPAEPAAPAPSTTSNPPSRVIEGQQPQVPTAPDRPAQTHHEPQAEVPLEAESSLGIFPFVLGGGLLLLVLVLLVARKS